MAQVIERINLDNREREAIENVLMTMRDIIDNTSSDDMSLDCETISENLSSFLSRWVDTN